MRLMAELAGMLIGAGSAAAQPIEDELVLITPVGKSLSDPALAEFRKLAKQRWNVEVRTSALSAGTPVAYGRIVYEEVNAKFRREIESAAEQLKKKY